MIRWRPLAAVVLLVAGLVYAGFKINSPSATSTNSWVVIGLSEATRAELRETLVVDFGEENIRPHLMVGRLNELAAEPGLFAWGGHWAGWEDQKWADQHNEHFSGGPSFADPKPRQIDGKPAITTLAPLKNARLDEVVEYLARRTNHVLVEHDGKIILAEPGSVEGELKAVKITPYLYVAGALRHYPGGPEAYLKQYGYLTAPGSYARFNWTGRELIICDVPYHRQSMAGTLRPTCGMGLPPYPASISEGLADLAYGLPERLRHMFPSVAIP